MNKLNSENIKVTETIFKEIKNEFPELKMEIDKYAKYVDLSMNIPKQSGLEFDINLNLQTDELHLSTDKIWCSWFPMKDNGITELYLNAVKGLIRGEYRILTFENSGKLYKSYLQKLYNSEWKTIAKDHKRNSFPWKKFTTNEIINTLHNTV